MEERNKLNEKFMFKSSSLFEMLCVSLFFWEGSDELFSYTFSLFLVKGKLMMKLPKKTRDSVCLSSSIHLDDI